MAKDRLNELKAQVKKKGNDEVAIDVNNENQGTSLKQTFERAEVLGQWIESIENNVVEIRRCFQKLDNINVNQRDLSDKIESLFQNNTSICHNINFKLKEIEAELKTSNDESVEGRIKTIQYNSIKTSYTVAFNKNNTELENFRFIQRSNLEAQLRAKGVKATDEELTHLLDNKADIQVFTDNILAETNEAKRVLADIQERHEQLIKIERMLVEVRDMFLQMAILVDGQQDIIDRVEYQAGLAKDYIGKAPKILSSAAKKRRKYIKIILANSVHNNKGGLYKFLEDWLGTGLLTSNGKKWQTRRKLLTPAFHFSILPKFVDIFNKETDELVTTLLQKSHQDYINVLEPITEFTLFTIGESSLGVNLRDLDSKSYKTAIRKYGEIAALRLVNPFYYFNLSFFFSSKKTQLNQATQHLHGVSTSIIQAKKRSKSNTDAAKLSYSERKKLALLDVLMEAGLRDEDIREEVDTFVFEGHDTTSMAICFMLVTLANEQEHQEAIYQEMQSVLGRSTRPSFSDLGELKFMEMCIKECLRLYPSVPVISRRAGCRIETSSGYTIPEGTQILLRIYDLHRSPYVWDDPDKFDPDRFLPDNVAKRHPFAYVPFSAGSRNCIGQKFAMLEMKTVLCGILRKFKLMPVDRREDLKFKIDLVLRPVGEIRVKFLPR